MSVNISELSTIYIESRVIATISGASYNPTADVVQIAFVTPGVTPVSGDWKTGSWETTAAGAYNARLLIGPAGPNVLAAGTYRMWIKITDSPEVPAMEAGTIRVY